MSALLNDMTSWLPFTVLAASFVGSSHCVAMCGGLAVAVSRTRASAFMYHLGRLAGYVGLGALAGAFGSVALKASSSSDPMRWISLASAVLVGTGLILLGARVWTGKPTHLPLLPRSVTAYLFRMGQESAAMTGFLTAFLPCGWLHAFVLGATATRSVWLGALSLGFFWVGTVPALGAFPWLANRFLKPLSLRSPRFAAVLLIIAGAVSIGAKVVPMASPAHSQAIHCHSN